METPNPQPCLALISTGLVYNTTPLGTSLPCPSSTFSTHRPTSSLAMEYSASHSRRQMRSARSLLPAVFVSWIVPFPAACASAILARSGYFTAFEFAREVSYRTSIAFFALQLMSLVGVLALIRMTGNKMRYFYCLTFVFIVLICSLSQYRDSLAVLASNIFSHFSSVPDSESSELAKKKTLEAVHKFCFVVTPYAVAEYVATLLPRSSTRTSTRSTRSSLPASPATTKTKRAWTTSKSISYGYFVSLYYRGLASCVDLFFYSNLFGDTIVCAKSVVLMQFKFHNWRSELYFGFLFYFSFTYVICLGARLHSYTPIMSSVIISLTLCYTLAAPWYSSGSGILNMSLDVR
ncbi:hypothetical protein BZA70DRAFT_155073 [Myxozyma melibiosi]|uniref:Uncharacterized protein n=1 Tax=Myxozyma melibiosi TaxID=54550 RepID=A0ABR1F6C0_9ASCO